MSGAMLEHIKTLQYLRNDSGPDEPYAAALDAGIAAAMAAQWGSLPAELTPASTYLTATPNQGES